MKIIICLCFFLFSSLSCTKKTVAFSMIDAPVTIESSTMEQYMLVLPKILNKSKQFRALDPVQKMSDEEFHKAFYAALFADPDIAIALKNINFTDEKHFGEFHGQVVYNYLIIDDIETGRIPNGNHTLSDTSEHIDYLEQQLSVFVLQKGREHNNKSLDEQIEHLERQIVALKNLLVVASFYSRLKELNQL